ncbi:hypothetical protein HK096_003581 [Nowakowskiella sp. JEL0078]|nr:hypothetical protein HK096_003581 [Nowakowskiella sp. JEL0078]
MEAQQGPYCSFASLYEEQLQGSVEICHNREALRHYRLIHERALFQKLAIQSAQYSSSEKSLYDSNDESIVKFSKLSDDQYMEIKNKIIGSGQQIDENEKEPPVSTLMDGFKKVTANVAKLMLKQ